MNRIDLADIYKRAESGTRSRKVLRRLVKAAYQLGRAHAWEDEARDAEQSTRRLADRRRESADGVHQQVRRLLDGEEDA